MKPVVVMLAVALMVVGTGARTASPGSSKESRPSAHARKPVESKRSVAAASPESKEGGRGVEEGPEPGAVPGAAQEGHRDGVHGQVLERAWRGCLPVRRVRPRPVQLREQVRLRNGLAELLAADRAEPREGRARREPRNGTRRGPLRAVWRAPRPRLRRWPAAHRSALLHQLRRAPVRGGEVAPA